MIVYTLTYLVNMLGFRAEKRNNRQFFVLTVFMLVFFTGMRYYMGGNDRYVYEGVYNSVPSVGVILKYIFTGVNQGVNLSYERGYLLLCAIIKSLGFSFFGFTLIWTIIFYTLMIKGLREFVPSWSIFLAVFMYKIMFYDTFTSMRQGLTIAIFCYILRFLRDRDWKKYFIWAFIAFFIHNGAIILFPIYFINYMPISKSFIRVYALAFLPTLLFSSKVDLSSAIMNVATFIGNTHSADHWISSTEEINIIHTIECYVIVILVLSNYKKIILNPRKEEVKLALRLFLVAIPMFTLFKDWIILTREKDYFVLMYGLILGYILDADGIVKGMEDGMLSPDDIDSINVLNLYRNEQILAIGVFAACLIGMVRYALVFDGGALMHYESFIFKEGAHLFRGW